MIFFACAKVFFHFNDIMNTHPCLDKYLFLLIAQVCTNRVSENIRYYIAQKFILQESSLSMWVGRWAGRQTQRDRQRYRKPVVPFTNRLTNVLYTSNTIDSQSDVMYVLQH
jgi:hypothetical protein